jgi:hypothetical protein
MDVFQGKITAIQTIETVDENNTPVVYKVYDLGFVKCRTANPNHSGGNVGQNVVINAKNSTETINDIVSHEIIELYIT